MQPDAGSVEPPLLGLPAPEPERLRREPGARSLELGGASVSLDALGPVVVNTDGTMARIANWSDMTPREQERTQRLLAARNNVRLATLRQAAELKPDALD